MRADEESLYFPMQGRGMDMYPFEHLSQVGSITIEQFVKELQKRKEAKEAKKKLKDPATKVLEKKKVNETPKAAVGNKNKKTRQFKPSKKEPNRPPSISVNENKPSQSPPLKRKTPKRPRRKPGNHKGEKNAKKITPPREVTEKKQQEKTPLLKPVVKTPVVKPDFKIPVAKQPERKPSTNKKPLKKTKNKVEKQETNEEDDDPFNFSNAVQHSDHHVHHHDHLEAHKHHHKHKESHAHEHAHSNDHVHNHKHTHNHVHNHIHKHNEAHEHAAEHTHTEKHTHKHLEYIDQGWRRRDQDPYMIMEEPTELVLQEREGRNNPRGQVKTELQNFINSFKKAYNVEAERREKTPEDIHEYKPFLEQDIVAHSPDTFSEPITDPQLDKTTDHNLIPNNEKALFDSSPTFASPSSVVGVSPLENASEYPVEVEEISYEEYLRLQKKGPTFEEELEDYTDYHTNYGDRFENSYGPVDQVSYSSEEHVISPGEFGDWVDMDLDLQYDMGPQYVDYQELERSDEDGENPEDIADYEEYLDMLETEMRMDEEADEAVTDDKEPEPAAEEDTDDDTEISGDTPDPTVTDHYSLDYRNFV